jgi:hypothetical protein
MMINVVAAIRFIVPDRPFVGQANILGIDHIAETIRRGGVVNIDGPKPQRGLRV